MNEKRSNEAKDKETTSGNRPENGPTMDDLEVRLTALAMAKRLILNDHSSKR